MKSKTVVKTSIFKATRKEMFEKLQEIKTLQHIAYPYATFEPVECDGNLLWKEGEVFSFKLKLFGFIPFGIHTIRVIRFDENTGIYTCEGNKHVPTWNHEIILESVDEGYLQYTDKVEIAAGWKTPFVYWWASLFYAHRQKKWRKLLHTN